MGQTISGEDICVKTKHGDNAIRFKYEINNELETEALAYIRERVNKKSTTSSEWANGIKIYLLQIEKGEKCKKRKLMKRIKDVRELKLSNILERIKDKREKL